MKKLRYITIIIVLAFMSSCEDYLETVPYSFTSPENFYQSAKEAEMALTGVYNILTAANVQGTGNQSTFSRNMPCMLNGTTDEAVIRNGFNNVDFTPWGNAGFTSESTLINESWFFLYAGINRANYLIEKLVAIDDFSGNRKIEIEAEAKLLRGFYHMTLSMMHGAIPVYTTSMQDPEQERQPLETVYTQILADYEFAYQNLPDRAKIAGHVNKWTASGLMVKALTYLASAKNSGLQNFGLALNSFDWVNANTNYQKALTISADIIANSGYILISDYSYLFYENTKSYQAQECLLTAEASSSANMDVVNMLVTGFSPQGNINVTGGTYGWFRPTGELYNKYNVNDARFSHNLTGNIPNTNTVEVIEGIRYYVPQALPNPNVGFYCIGKYRMMDPKLKVTSTWATSTSFPLLRYADVLLMHAEAQFFTGDETGARNTLTTIRQRAVQAPATVADLNTAYNKSDFVAELLDERSRELCFENWRRIDLARFNKYDETIAGLSNDAGFYNTIVPTIKQNWKPEKVWFPIPLPQRDLNPNLEQNPGY
jgi:hypothetical protein